MRSHSQKSARFLLADFDAEGVCLDLRSGNVFRLNALALAVARGLFLGRPSRSLARELSTSFAVDTTRALADIRTIRATLHESAAPHRPTSTALQFLPGTGRFLVRWQNSRLLEIRANGRHVRRVARRLPVPPAMLLQWALPHLLWLQGQPVIHASAVARGRCVIALAGPSGAGKTTLAHALAQRPGVRLIAEDLLLLHRGTPVGVSVAAEPALRAWVSAAAANLELPGGELAVADLAALAGPVSGQLGDVLFLDDQQRRGSSIATTPLTPATAMERLLINSFAELGERAVWQQVFEMCRTLVAEARICEACVPRGLKRLQRAAKAYSWT